MAFAFGLSLLLHGLALSLLPGFRPASLRPAETLQVELAPKPPPPSLPPPPLPKPEELMPFHRPVVSVKAPPSRERPLLKREPPAPKPILEPVPPPPQEARTEQPAASPVLTAPAQNAVAPEPPVVAAAPPHPAPANPAPSDDAALAEYGSALSSVIAKNQSYPRLALIRGWEGIAQVAIRVAPGGKVREVRLAHSSGYPVLDQQALDMVRQSLPLPSPPASLRLREFVVVIPIVFKLRS